MEGNYGSLPYYVGEQTEEGDTGMTPREQRLLATAEELADIRQEQTGERPQVRQVSPTLYRISFWSMGCACAVYVTETATLPTRAMIADASGMFARFWIFDVRTDEYVYASESRLLGGTFTYRDAALAD